jgi:Ca-activated chloride channel family protein
MKLRTAALSAILAAGGSIGAAMFAPLPTVAVASPSPQDPALTAGAVDHSRFDVGQTLHLDARLGHASLAKGADGETYLFASVAGADAARAAPPLNLAVVVDKSGSMKGERIARAIDAGVGIVERMRDGDVITVVDFDTAADVVVAPTRLTSTNRASVESAIRGIRLGGDTCISCGLETAATQLRAAPVFGEHVTRMIVLSDGATNHGVTDMMGLRSIAARMRDRGCAITTIGVDVDFDEKVMAALATESNGRHYFVASAAGLPAIFSQELDSLVASVAQDVDMTVELGPSVSVDQVFDRTFRRETSSSGTQRIVIPFGVIAAKQEKTALLKLHVSTERDGEMPVANVSLAYHDLLARETRREEGKLELMVKSDGTAQTDIDPFVAARVERSRTVQTLTAANALFEGGHFEEAEKTLATRETELHMTAMRHRGFAGPQAGRLTADFDKQLDVVAQAEANFAPVATASAVDGVAGGSGGGGHASMTPMAPARKGLEQVRQNQQDAVDLAR